MGATRIGLTTDWDTFDSIIRKALLLFNDHEPARRVKVREVRFESKVPVAASNLLATIPDSALRKEVASMRSVNEEVQELTATLMSERLYSPATDIECFTRSGMGICQGIALRCCWVRPGECPHDRGHPLCSPHSLI